MEGRYIFEWKLIKTLPQVYSETILVWHLRNVGKVLVSKLIGFCGFYNSHFTYFIQIQVTSLIDGPTSDVIL